MWWCCNLFITTATVHNHPYITPIQPSFYTKNFCEATPQPHHQEREDNSFGDNRKCMHEYGCYSCWYRSWYHSKCSIPLSETARLTFGHIFCFYFAAADDGRRHVVEWYLKCIITINGHWRKYIICMSFQFHWKRFTETHWIANLMPIHIYLFSLLGAKI